MKKRSILLSLTFLLLSSYFWGQQGEAAVTAAEECTIESSETDTYQEIPMEEKMRLLRETAIKHNIPPEILKAIASVESGMKQFKNGKPLITCDGGIGMMQITNAAIPVEEERLKYDTAYNIEIGAQILKSKWALQSSGRIPTINDGNPNILENWYFAVMAYNGLSAINDPNKIKEGDRPAYQETVYKTIAGSSQVQTAAFPGIETAYTSNGVLTFPNKQLNWETAATESTQMFTAGDEVQVMNTLDPKVYPYANVRVEPSTGAKMIAKPAYYTKLQIIEGPYIDSANFSNQFVMYKVKGPDFEGYIASSNLKRQEADTTFKQWEEKSSADVRKKWTIKLNQPLNSETVNPRNVYIVDESGTGIFTTITYQAGDTFMTVGPAASFEAGKKYSLMIKNVRSAANKPLKENVLLPFSITP